MEDYNNEEPIYVFSQVKDWQEACDLAVKLDMCLLDGLNRFVEKGILTDSQVDDIMKEAREYAISLPQ